MMDMISVKYIWLSAGAPGNNREIKGKSDGFEKILWHLD